MKKMLTSEVFIIAEKQLGKNKKDNRAAQYIAKNAEVYGKRLLKKIQDKTFEWHKPRLKTITDTYKGKTRDLRIPCLEDQAAQLAWLYVAIPYIEKRNYYYNCGSIPKAGQTRAVKGLKKKLKNKRVKYGATTDIRKFYDTCPHWVIRKGLYRIFKDKEFVEFAMGFVASMSETDVGIAIGYPSSHWLANVALMELDHEVKRKYPDVFYARYMDDIAMASTNKRHIRNAVEFVKRKTELYQMKLKRWAVFKIKPRGISFLSYRFFNGYTLMIKRLMVRIARRFKKITKLTRHAACSVMSYMGILKHCNSYNFRISKIYPYITERECINAIRRGA